MGYITIDYTTNINNKYAGSIYILYVYAYQLLYLWMPSKEERVYKKNSHQN